MISTPKRNVIICDVDGTLRDPSGRLHLIPSRDDMDRTEGWRKFNMACFSDAPTQRNIDLVNSLFDHGYVIYLVSGCSLEARDITRHWMTEHGVQFSYLIMRPEDDHRIAGVFKKEVLETIGMDNIAFCIEDNPKQAELMESWGLHVIRVPYLHDGI